MSSDKTTSTRNYAASTLSGHNIALTDSFDTQELSERVPIDGMFELFLDGAVQHDKTVERVHDGNILEEAKVGVGDLPVELSLPVHADDTEKVGKDRRNDLKDDVLEDSVLALEDKFDPEFPRVQDLTKRPGMFPQIRVRLLQ